MAIGGSIESVVIDDRRFAVTADTDSNRKLGGFENEIERNGDGTGRQLKTRVAWTLDSLTVEIDDDRGDQEYLQDLSDSSVFFPILITYASGIRYTGDGQLTGEFQASSANASAQINLKGVGELIQL